MQGDGQLRGGAWPRRRVRRPFRVALVTLVSCVAATFVVTPHVSIATAPLVPDRTPAVDGTVEALATVGPRVVLAGPFGTVGDQPRDGVAALLPSGRVDPGFAPTVDGSVAAVAVSPDARTVFLGGDFTAVDGVRRSHVAAVDAVTGAVDRRWRVRTAHPVTALAVSGDTLIVATGEELVAVAAADGVRRPGFDPLLDGPVHDLVAGSGLVYAAGTFTTVDGRRRDAGLVGLRADGTPTPFDPVGLDEPVEALALGPDGTRLVVAAGTAISSFVPARSDLPAWETTADAPARALAVGTHAVFAGGAFERFEGSPGTLPGLAALDAADGRPTGWGLPTTGGEGPRALALTSAGLVVGGEFGTAGGHARTNLLRLRTAGPATGVDAGRDLRHRDDARVSLQGSVRLPEGRTAERIAWRQVAGAPVELVTAAAAVATFDPNPGRDTLAFELSVVDDTGVRWRDAVTVEIVATPTVAVLGDSLTARQGPHREPPTRETATRRMLVEAGWDPDSIYWWARGGKTLTTPDYSSRTTFDNIDDATTALGGPVDLVYVGLGTNDSAARTDEFAARVGSVLDALDGAGTGTVVWMNLSFRSPEDPRSARLNPVLAEQVEARGWTVVDFDAHLHSEDVFDPADWVYADDSSDRVHLTAQGYAKRDALMVDALVGQRDR